MFFYESAILTHTLAHTYQENWKCNNNVHPSRHGTYDGIAFHPFETIFVKASW